MPTFSIARPTKIYPNWYFWFENKSSGNPYLNLLSLSVCFQANLATFISFSNCFAMRASKRLHSFCFLCAEIYVHICPGRDTGWTYSAFLFQKSCPAGLNAGSFRCSFIFSSLFSGAPDPAFIDLPGR
jgi:hypothetical protein